MELPLFRLEKWLEERQPSTRYDLAASTGPAWTFGELMDLLTPEEREAVLGRRVTYPPTSGSEDLRDAIATMQGVTPRDVQIVTGASEALLVLFFLAKSDGANVLVPSPGFPTFTAIPEGLGIETRRYELRPENGFELDVDEIKALADDRTALLLVNSPHNPTGSIVSRQALGELHDFCTERGIQYVVDEVYHPIYHGQARPSAAELPRATILGDFSKSLCLSGLRVGWIVERSPERIEEYWNARGYFTIANGSIGESLARLALEHREEILARARGVAAANLDLLDRFMHERRDTLRWVRPKGGFTGFPSLTSGENSRRLCIEAAERGVLLAPGDGFGYPSHFRLGFGACQEGFDRALDVLSDITSAVARH